MNSLVIALGVLGVLSVLTCGFLAYNAMSNKDGNSGNSTHYYYLNKDNSDSKVKDDSGAKKTGKEEPNNSGAKQDVAGPKENKDFLDLGPDKKSN